jgi:lipopolysaccharide export system permease protein
MRKLDRYVLGELFVPLLIGTVVIALLFVANDLIAIYKTFNVEAVPRLAIVQLLLYKLPSWLNYTFPVGMALGASLAVSRLARESEITAMRAAGIRVSRIVLPVVWAGLLVSLANYWVVERLVPPATKEYRRLSSEVGFLGSVPQFRSNVLLEIDRYVASFGSVERMGDGSVRLRDVLMIERPRAGEVVVTLAESGWFKDGVWSILSPTVYHLKGSHLNTLESKDAIKINEPIRISDVFMPPMPEEETVESLSSAIAQAKSSAQPTTSLELALHQRFAVVASCLVFGLLGSVLAVKFARAGPFIGVLVSLGLVWLYMNLFVISGDIFAKNGWLSPLMAAWMPNGLYVVASLVFMRNIE